MCILKQITVNYYGKLTEMVGTHKEQVQTSAKTIGDFSHFLTERHPALLGMTLQVAQNNHIETSEALLSSDGVDVFPPFSGG